MSMKIAFLLIGVKQQLFSSWLQSFIAKDFLRKMCIEPGWEESLGEKGHVCMDGWAPLLSTWSYHNAVDWLYPNTKYTFQNIKGRELCIHSTHTVLCFIPPTAPLKPPMGPEARSSRAQSCPFSTSEAPRADGKDASPPARGRQWVSVPGKPS